MLVSHMVTGRRASWLLVLLFVVAVSAILARWYAFASIVLGLPKPAQNEDLRERPCPVFKAKAVDGRELSTRTLHGRVIVVDIWATWCQPCVHELPHIERDLWARYRGEVIVLGIAAGESEATVRSFNARAQLTFPLVADPERHLYGLFPGNAIPRTYVIDRNGQIIQQYIGYSPETVRSIVKAVEHELN